MNTEETIKQKQYEKKVCLDGAAYHQSLVQEFETKAENIDKEIASLSSPEEPKALTFLQLAEKLDQRLFGYITVKLYRGGKVHILPSYIREFVQLGISLTQARKFVAEIYLTLLAKELNGEYGGNERHYPFIGNNGTEICVIGRSRDCFSGVWFKNYNTFKIALTYSEESKLMFNWYFGRGKWN